MSLLFFFCYINEVFEFFPASRRQFKQQLWEPDSERQSGNPAAHNGSKRRRFERLRQPRLGDLRRPVQLRGTNVCSSVGTVCGSFITLYNWNIVYFTRWENSFFFHLVPCRRVKCFQFQMTAPYRLLVWQPGFEKNYIY